MLWLNHIKHRQAGISLIESLIALVILSIALIGVGAMFAKSLGVSHGAYMRSLASIQAMDMAERIRSNVFLDHETLTYESGEMTNDEVTDDACGSVTANLDCLGSCTPEELLAADLSQWCADNTELFTELFSGAAIRYEDGDDCPGTDSHCYTIGIEWYEREPNISPSEGVEIKTIYFGYKMRL